MDHNALEWMLSYNDLNQRLIRWRLRCSKFNYDILYCPEMVHCVLHAISRLQHASYNQYIEIIDDDIFTFQSSPVALERLLKEKSVLAISFLDISSETINVRTQSHTASHTSDDDNLDNDSIAND